MHKICIVGAGNIAPAHVKALRALPGVSIVGVCDTLRCNAASLARRYGISNIFQSVDEAVASGTFDYAHVLVPPPHHAHVCLSLLQAGVNVLVEKPLATSATEAQKLVDMAKSRELRLGVNHNYLFYPAYVRLRNKVAGGKLGAIRHVAAELNLPIPFGSSTKHWMFERPENVIYESAPHPFSIIYDLAGKVRSVHATPACRQELGGGAFYFATWQVALECENATAYLFLRCGQTFPSNSITVTCEDGMVHADLVNNRVITSQRTKWPGFYDSFLNGARAMAALGSQSAANLCRATVTLARASIRTDPYPYRLSMTRSITSFHTSEFRALRRHTGGEAGVEVVRMCDLVASSLPNRSPAQVIRRRDGRSPATRCDVAVIGGTGFIGRHVVRRLIENGRSVRVFARSAPRAEAPFDHPLMEVFRGDIADRQSVLEGLQGADRVVHLAHGGRLDPEGVESSMIAGTRYVADACLRSGVHRLVYVGSIASLYLGERGTVISAATPNDPRAAERGPYAAGKVSSEEILHRFREQHGLQVCILRPGIVLGEGGTPFHFGFGEFRNEIHCLGWSAGDNPLPLVLVEDVADAIVLALDAPDVAGRTYNLVGDVRLSARECIDELTRVLAPRPMRFHPRHPAQIQSVRLAVWIVRAAFNKHPRPIPSYRDVLSNACFASFDCSVEKADLGWTPVRDVDHFVRRAFDVHRPVADVASSAVDVPRGVHNSLGLINDEEVASSSARS